MKLKIFLIIYLLVHTFIIRAQGTLSTPMNDRVIVHMSDCVIYAEILGSDEDKVKVKDDLYYYWFAANDIKRTKGGFEGKLLHGAYTQFYLNKNLKEKGTYKFGMKDGEWKSWYNNGEMKELTHWIKGVQHGESKIYTESGKLIETGNYKKGLKHGEFIKYSSDGTSVKYKYKNGVLKEAKKGKTKKMALKESEKKDKTDLPNNKHTKEDLAEEKFENKKENQKASKGNKKNVKVISNTEEKLVK